MTQHVLYKWGSSILNVTFFWVFNGTQYTTQHHTMPDPTLCFRLLDVSKQIIGFFFHYQSIALWYLCYGLWRQICSAHFIKRVNETLALQWKSWKQKHLPTVDGSNFFCPKLKYKTLEVEGALWSPFSIREAILQNWLPIFSSLAGKYWF